MNLDPKLTKTDRIASFVAGAVMVAYAASGSLDKVPLQIVVAVVGVVLVVGGFGGT